jgi:hypothetical protein
MAVRKVGKNWCFLHRCVPIALIFLLMLCPSALAIDSVCRDASTLRIPWNYTFIHETAQHNLTVYKDMPCAYGCDNVTNRCAPNPVELNAYAIIAVVAIIIIGSKAAQVLTHG